MLRYGEVGYEVFVMGDFNAHIGLGQERVPNRNGQRLLHLVGAANLVIGNLSCVCSGRWTWESRGLRSVVDHFLLSGGLALNQWKMRMIWDQITICCG